jgi:hypothetical protein
MPSSYPEMEVMAVLGREQPSTALGRAVCRLHRPSDRSWNRDLPRNGNETPLALHWSRELSCDSCRFCRLSVRWMRERGDPWRHSNNGGLGRSQRSGHGEDRHSRSNGTKRAPTPRLHRIVDERRAYQRLRAERPATYKRAGANGGQSFLGIPSVQHPVRIAHVLRDDPGSARPRHLRLPDLRSSATKQRIFWCEAVRSCRRQSNDRCRRCECFQRHDRRYHCQASSHACAKWRHAGIGTNGRRRCRSAGRG